jgi:hypothetical protein
VSDEFKDGWTYDSFYSGNVAMTKMVNSPTQEIK